MKQTVLTIDRGQWLNATVMRAVNTPTRCVLSPTLRDHDSGLQCCLAFGMRKCGATIASIEDIGLPSNAPSDRVEGTALYETLQLLEMEASRVNDASNYTPGQRETALRHIFAKHDITLRFTGSTRAAIARAKKAYGVS